jgi:hypothetical protein
LAERPIAGTSAASYVSSDERHPPKRGTDLQEREGAQMSTRLSILRFLVSAAGALVLYMVLHAAADIVTGTASALTIT